VPALLATAAVHHALVNRGLRLRASLVVETGDARDAHQIGLLCGYGASAVCPSLGYDTIVALADSDPTGCDVAVTRYRLAIERGLRTLMSKMGVCTFSGYCGAQLFEILGLHASVVDRFFPGTASPVGGATLSDIAATVLARHQRAFATEPPAVEYPGLHGFRRDGEYHATNPVVVRGLQQSRDEAAQGSGHAYETFTSHVYGRPRRRSEISSTSCPRNQRRRCRSTRWNRSRRSAAASSRRRCRSARCRPRRTARSRRR